MLPLPSKPLFCLRPSAASAAASSSSLPSPLRPFISRRRRNNSNHLRTKLLQPPLLHTSKPSVPTTPHQDLDVAEAPPLPLETHFLQEKEELEEEEHEEVPHLASRIGDPLPHTAATVNPPNTLLGMPPFLGSLLVSAYVLLLFDGNGWTGKEALVEEETKGGESSSRKEEWGQLEEKVQEIRSMAREAQRREKEGEEDENEDEGSSDREIGMEVRKEVERRAKVVAEGRMHALLAKDKHTKSGKGVDENGRSGETISMRKKFEFDRMRAAANARSPTQGFGGAKSRAAAGKGPRGDDGAIQQIRKDVLLESRTSQVDRGNKDARFNTPVDSKIQTTKSSFDGLHPETHSEEDGRLKSSSVASGSGVDDMRSNIVQDASPNGSFSKNNDRMDGFVMHSGGAIDAGLKEEPMLSGMLDSRGSSKKRPQRKETSTNGSINNKSSKQLDKTKHKSDPRFENNHKANGEYWWLKLPYVLVICLQRGSNGSSQRGFYKLKVDPLSDSTLSYTVAFQDRVDATNFCHLLELFFEDLGDVRADILPVTTQEIEEEVKSSKLNLIVVRKGQLKLYAGQPLEEVETTLRFSLQQSVSM